MLTMVLPGKGHGESKHFHVCITYPSRAPKKRATWSAKKVMPRLIFRCRKALLSSSVTVSSLIVISSGVLTAGGTAEGVFGSSVMAVEDQKKGG